MSHFFCEPARRVRTVLAVVVLFSALPVIAYAADNDATAHNVSSGWYFAGKGGPVVGFTTGISSQPGQPFNDDNAINMIGGFGISAGYTWAKQHLPMRTEIELLNRTEIGYNSSPLFSSSSSNDAVASDIQKVTVMAKGYYHINSGSRSWSPFLIAGLGLSHTAVSGQYTPAGGTPAELDKVTYGLAWTAGIGISLFLGKNLVNDIELSYADLGDVDWGLPAATNFESSTLGGAQIIFALRYDF